MPDLKQYNVYKKNHRVVVKVNDVKALSHYDVIAPTYADV